jgi:2-polyprenyl-6-methoxyphenol hydroxylase-like FAD-dependent oxidoreductase
MSDIGIVGTGISGLTLALMLQQHGVDCTVYAERTADELRGGRLPNTVVRYGATIPRERGLGVNHWDGVELGPERIYFSATGTPISFSGPLPDGGSAVDFRVYLPRLLEDFEGRGGSVVVAPWSRQAAADLAERHRLIVVATGREAATAGLGRDPDRSVHTAPRRLLCAGLWHGIDELGPPGVSYTLAPGVGEVFQFPMFTADGQISAVLIEAVPGGPLAPLADDRLAADRRAFEALALRLVRDHAPALAERVTGSAFRLTGPLDLFQGAVTPTVRQTWRALSPGRFAIAVGDAWIVNDPITGQGANLGSACAAVLADLIVTHAHYDERFCREADRRMWTVAEPVCLFSNAMLEPPPPHVLELLAAATEHQVVADAFTTSFGNPPAMWAALASESGAASFVDAASSRADMALKPT